MFELFEHTADLGLRIKARTLAELLAEAGRGLLAMLVANPEAVQPVQSKSIQLGAEEPKYLLFDWLNELLYAFETDRLLLCQFDVHFEDGRLSATCRGEPMDSKRHEMDHEVKAITYHGLSVDQQNGTWIAEVIVDI
jgi:SHS2 domain-containing protein